MAVGSYMVLYVCMYVVSMRQMKNFNVMMIGKGNDSAVGVIKSFFSVMRLFLSICIAHYTTHNITQRFRRAACFTFALP